MESIPLAELQAGAGLVGDRYHSAKGTFSAKLEGTPDAQLTLIEAEQIDRFNQAIDNNYAYGAFRRNIVTRGIRLNDLVGKEFLIGNIRLRGIRLCEPCAHLARLLHPEVVAQMTHRAGLRAQIIGEGDISVGDPVTD